MIDQQPHANRLPRYPKCCVCGTGERSGISVCFYVERDEVRADFTPTEANMGFPGVTHGGVISALLDEIMGWAPTLRTGRFCVTGELTVRFVRPLPIGHPVTVIGRAEKVGRVYTGTGEVVDAEGEVFARASGKYIPMSDDETTGVLNILVSDELTLPQERWYKEASGP